MHGTPICLVIWIYNHKSCISMTVQLFLFYRLKACSCLIDRAIGFCDDLVKIYCTSLVAKERLGNHFHNLLYTVLYCSGSLSHIRAFRKRLFGSWLYMAMSSSSWRHAQTVLQSSSQQRVLAHVAVLLQSEGGMILEQAEKQVFSLQAVKP